MLHVGSMTENRSLREAKRRGIPVLHPLWAVSERESRKAFLRNHSSVSLTICVCFYSSVFSSLSFPFLSFWTFSPVFLSISALSLTCYRITPCLVCSCMHFLPRFTHVLLWFTCYSLSFSLAYPPSPPSIALMFRTSPIFSSFYCTLHVIVVYIFFLLDGDYG